MTDRPSQVVTFFIGEKEFCIDARMVRSVVRMGPITKVPGVSNFVVGAMYSRGDILPIIDLVCLGVGNAVFNSYTRIIIAEYNGELIGLAVGSVGETVKVPDNTSDTFKSFQPLSLDSRQVLFLDLNQLLQAQTSVQAREGTK